MNITDCLKCCKSMVKMLWKIIGIYIIWIIIYYVATHLYVKYCTPYTVVGFITAPLLVASPYCTGLRWCISRGADTIIAMWIVLGTWIAVQLGGYPLR